VLCYTSQNVGEFWNTCTRPLDRNGYALSAQETDRRARFFEQKLRLLPDSLAVHEEWRRLLVTVGVSGVQVHDARLAAAMRVHGIKQILTFNDRDFARYTDIEAVHPRTIPIKAISVLTEIFFEPKPSLRMPLREDFCLWLPVKY
jgi:predicted nucleic acid-binding protein